MSGYLKIIWLDQPDFAKLQENDSYVKNKSQIPKPYKKITGEGKKNYR